jgi:hypothetical protein
MYPHPQVDPSPTTPACTTVIQNIRASGEELGDEQLRLVTGGMSQPDGGVSYLGGPAGCWGDHDPNLPR